MRIDARVVVAKWKPAGIFTLGRESGRLAPTELLRILESSSCSQAHTGPLEIAVIRKCKSVVEIKPRRTFLIEPSSLLMTFS